jgi:hypothetical protein
MSEAVVIPFPIMRRPPQGPASGSQIGDERLALALHGLHEALEEQAQAVKAWRFAMAELGVGVAGLGQAMAAYDGSLSQLDERLAGLRDNALALEAMADKALMS